MFSNLENKFNIYGYNGIVTIDFTLKYFGELYFYMKDEKVHISNGCMSKEQIKKILNAMVDDSILDY